MSERLRLVYADPPYLGQCASYGHFHNDGGAMPWDGKCWDLMSTHFDLLTLLAVSYDGWAYSCNPVALATNYDLADANSGVRVAAWCKTWHQIRRTSTQYAWEPVVFRPARKMNDRTPMVRDWLSCPVAKQTGQRGAKPDAFNDWILDLPCYEPGDDLIDLFPGSGGMARAIERRNRSLLVLAPDTPEGGE